MCPACIAAAALIAGSALSTGALTAVVSKRFWSKNRDGIVARNERKENRHGQ
jgi:hypothetical protein